MKLYFHGSVRDGKINLPKRMRQELIQFFDGKPIKITVERNKARRSDLQNRYYWGVVLPYVRDGFIEAGNSLQRNGESIVLVHELMKDKFLNNGQEVVNKEGEVMQGRSTTTALSKDEMGEYIESIKRWSLEYLGINIPDPGEEIEINS